MLLKKSCILFDVVLAYLGMNAINTVFLGCLCRFFGNIINQRCHWLLWISQFICYLFEVTIYTDWINSVKLRKIMLTGGMPKKTLFYFVFYKHRVQFPFFFLLRKGLFMMQTWNKHPEETSDNPFREWNAFTIFMKGSKLFLLSIC